VLDVQEQGERQHPRGESSRELGSNDSSDA
jgi:hypothetical protein